MAFSINTNITSMQAQAALNRTQQFQAKTINRVTTGLRIVNSGDDAAGLAVANGLRSDQAVLTQGLQNLNSAQTTLQTVDNGMSNISGLLDRARTLATQSSSDAFTGDRNVLNNEFQSVLTEINRQSQAAGINVGGTYAKSMEVYVGGGTAGNGATAGSNGSVKVDLTNATVDTQSLGLVGVAAQTAAITNVGSYLTAVKTGPATLTMSGVGFSDTGAVTVTVSMTGVNTLDDLAAAINSGIAQSANQNGANFDKFRAAGITASIDTSTAGSPKLTFTAGSAAFQVSDGGDGQAQKVLAGGVGTAAATTIASVGTFKSASSTAFTSVATAGTQTITFQTTDSTGALKNFDVNLTALATTADQAVTMINTQLQGSPDQGTKNIVAVKNSAGTVDFLSTTNFNINIATDSVGVGAGFAPGAKGAAAGTSSSKVDITTATGATNAVAALSTAVTKLGAAQAIVGKGENNLSYATSLASSQLVNMAASESAIRDADLASEAANLSKAQILSQAGVAALAQANSAPQAVLSLLKG